MTKVMYFPRRCTSIARQARECCKKHTLCMRCGLAEFSIGLLAGVTLALLLGQVIF